MKKLVILPVFLLVMSLAPKAMASVTYPPGDCTVSDAKLALDAEENKELTLFNNYRTQNGLQTVIITPFLQKAATWHAIDMYVNAYLSHTDSLGRNTYQLVADCGYTYGLTNNVAEIAGRGYTTAQAIFDAWKASPGHNAMMLFPSFNEVGIGREDYVWSAIWGERADNCNDTQSPSLVVNSPTNGATVSGLTDVNVTASDDCPNLEVSVMVDSTTIGTLKTTPYVFSWDTTKFSNGPHNMQVSARDVSGKSKSIFLSLNVNNNFSDTIPPVVSLTSPANGQTVSGVINVTASASDNVGVAKVEFYLDGGLKNSDSSSPYSYALDTTQVSNGAHTLEARAYDVSGNMGSSGVYNVNVNNNPTDTQAPTVTITSPQDGSTVTGNVTVSANANDNVAVTKMELYIDNVLKTTTSTNTISARWNTRKVFKGAHLITVKAYDAAGNIGLSQITVTK